MFRVDYQEGIERLAGRIETYTRHRLQNSRGDILSLTSFQSVGTAGIYIHSHHQLPEWAGDTSLIA